MVECPPAPGSALAYAARNIRFRPQIEEIEPARRSQRIRSLASVLNLPPRIIETLLIRDGLLTEGSASSAFVVRAGVLVAPPQSHLVLPGITYEVVLELADHAGVPVEIRAIPEAELRVAEEIWLTSSTKEITAVTRLDGQPVGSGRPGPLYRRLHGLYQSYKHTVMRGRDG